MSIEAKCECIHCGGHIAFPSEGDGQAIICPHCGVHTILRSNDVFVEGNASHLKWFFKGAKLGDVESMAHLGVAYLEGLGVPKNYDEALKWLRQSAEQGNATAQGNLGVCYIKPTFRSPKV